MPELPPAYFSEYLAKHRMTVGASTFLGFRIDSLDREQLLGLVGWLMDNPMALTVIDRNAVGKTE